MPVGMAIKIAALGVAWSKTIIGRTRAAVKVFQSQTEHKAVTTQEDQDADLSGWRFPMERYKHVPIATVYLWSPVYL